MMAIKSIFNDELQDKLLTVFMESRYFGEDNWFAARREIIGLNDKIDELKVEISKKYADGEKGSTAKKRIKSE